MLKQFFHSLSISSTSSNNKNRLSSKTSHSQNRSFSPSYSDFSSNIYDNPDDDFNIQFEMVDLDNHNLYLQDELIRRDSINELNQNGRLSFITDAPLNLNLNFDENYFEENKNVTDSKLVSKANDQSTTIQDNDDDSKKSQNPNSLISHSPEIDKDKQTIEEESNENYAMNQQNEYGFVGNTNEQNEKWKNHYEIMEIKRKDQWISIDLSRCNKLKLLIRKGIPVNLRPGIWYTISGSLERHQTMAAGYIKNLSDQTINCPNKIIKDITKDLDRTFPSHPLFQKSETLQKLKDLLVLFSLHSPKIGYVQSLNFIAGFFLIFYNCNVEKAFIMLDTLLNHIIPQDYYTKNMIGLQTDIKVLDFLLQKKLPHIYNYLQYYNIDVLSVCSSWFLLIFINILPIETLLRVMDCIFYERNKILFRISLALFKLYENDILKCQDFGSLFRVLNNLGKTCYHCDLLLSTAFYGLGSLSRKTIQSLRKKFRPDVIKQINNFEKLRNEYEYDEAKDNSNLFTSDSDNDYLVV